MYVISPQSASEPAAGTPLASCVRVRAPSQAALSYALMTVVWDVGAGTSVIKKVGWYVP